MVMSVETEAGDRPSSLLFESLLEQNDDTAADDNKGEGGSPPNSSSILPIAIKAPSKCPLFCCFYSEFDIKKGPVVSFQSPKGFMDQDIDMSTHQIQHLLARTFQELADKGEAQVPAKSTATGGGTTNNPLETNIATASAQSNDRADDNIATTSTSTDAGESSVGIRSQPSTLSLGSITDELPSNVDAAPIEPPRAMDSSSTDQPHPLPNNSTGLSIFDSTSEYIITGAELTSKNITLSTHSWHIMTRPTMISNVRYERNALLFSVGFILRRAADPSPFRPLLSKLAVTLQAMEEESRFLTSPQKRPKIQTLLERVLLSLNSSEWECNLLLSRSNALHLKLYHPPKPDTSPVHDHQVPILLRRDLQLQMV